MTLRDRDKRALILGVPALIMILIYVATAPKETKLVAPVAAKESIPIAEQRLARMRQSVARVPGKEAVLQQVRAELKDREKNLIVADTAAQATERLLQIVRQVTRAQLPPIELRSIELIPPHSFGEFYGEISVAITAECHMDQLVNLMSDLTARKELISTRDLRLSAGNPKEKTVNVRLTLAGLVPRQLVPRKTEAF